MQSWLSIGIYQFQSVAIGNDDELDFVVAVVQRDCMH